MNDYISREAAIDACFNGWNNNAHDCAENIRSIPAADVRPVKRGKWIPVGTDDMDEGMFRCSECGSEHFFPELLLKIPADNFCSNCGAVMEVSSDG